MKIQYYCDDCGTECFERESHYNKKKRHFCNTDCYSRFRKNKLPKEEQNAYKGGGLPPEERQKRMKARSDANHAMRDGKIKKQNCIACGSKYTQMHHSDYNKPLCVTFLCRKCHWDEHKMIYENPELLTNK